MFALKAELSIKEKLFKTFFQKQHKSVSLCTIFFISSPLHSSRKNQIQLLWFKKEIGLLISHIYTYASQG